MGNGMEDWMSEDWGIRRCACHSQQYNINDTSPTSQIITDLKVIRENKTKRQTNTVLSVAAAIFLYKSLTLQKIYFSR